VYSTANVFIIPSLMDNLPNTVLEAMMCGIPTVGFETGGIPEMVVDGITGFISKDISVSGMKSTILKYLDNPEIFNTENIRKFAIENYSLTKQVNAYIDLYRSILDNNI